MIENTWNDSKMTVTFNTTEDCPLRCKYCYEIHKNPRSLSLDYAKKFVDVLFTDPDPCNVLNDPDPTFNTMYNRGIVFDAIGGDSLVDPAFLDKLYTYIVKKFNTNDPTYSENVEKWKKHFRFSISSNGVLFLRDDVRALCEKWSPLLGVAVSIDGCPTIHDMNRIYTDGRGSMHDILSSWDWYRKTFPTDSYTTKATCARDSIPYLRESLEFMHENLGIKYINQNFIMEDTGCTQEDYKLLDQQLEKCVEYVLEHRHDLYWSMIDKTTMALAHLSTGKDWDLSGHCGSGAMPALGIDGYIYPCFRWLNHTQTNGATLSVGNIWDGFIHKENFSKVREGAYRCNCTRDEKCRTCPVESACSYCIGGCFSEFGDFIRTTYICDITKLQVKWARIYWDEYNKLEGLPKIDWEKEGANFERLK